MKGALKKLWGNWASFRYNIISTLASGARRSWAVRRGAGRNEGFRGLPNNGQGGGAVSTNVTTIVAVIPVERGE